MHVNSKSQQKETTALFFALRFCTNTDCHGLLCTDPSLLMQLGNSVEGYSGNITNTVLCDLSFILLFYRTLVQITCDHGIKKRALL